MIHKAKLTRLLRGYRERHAWLLVYLHLRLLELVLHRLRL